MKMIYLLLLLFVSIALVSAATYNDCTIYGNCKPITPGIIFNNNTFGSNTSVSADFWDNLDTPADINAGDITDDNTYVQIIGDTMTGDLTTTGTITGGFLAGTTGGVFGTTLFLYSGEITDTTGAISFDNENLITTGTGTDSQHIITKEAVGGDVNLTLRNTVPWGGSATETVSLIAQTTATPKNMGKIVFGRADIYDMDFEQLSFMDFYTTGNAADTLALRIDENQNFIFQNKNLTNISRIGIGTTSPTHTLNVVGDDNITGNLIVGDINKESEQNLDLFGGTDVGPTTDGNRFTVNRKAVEGDGVIGMYITQYEDGYIYFSGDAGEPFGIATAGGDITYNCGNGYYNIFYDDVRMDSALFLGGEVDNVVPSYLYTLDIKDANPTIRMDIDRTVGGGIATQMFELYATDRRGTIPRAQIGSFGVYASMNDIDVNPSTLYVYLNANTLTYWSSQFKFSRYGGLGIGMPSGAYPQSGAGLILQNKHFYMNGSYSIYFGYNNQVREWFDGTNFNLHTTSGVFNVLNNSGYGTIVANEFRTATSVYDKGRGNALDLIKDSDELKTDGKIDDTKFAGYSTIEITDMARPVNQSYEEEFCEMKSDEKTGKQNEVCHNETKWGIVYPYKTIQDTVSLNTEIDVLRQAVYELKLKVKELELKVK